MVRTACKGSTDASKPASPGRPVQPLLLLFLEAEEQEDLRRRMDEFMLHEEYHKSTVGEKWRSTS